VEGIFKDYPGENYVMIRLGLLFGGRSAEREVSIAGAGEVEKALDKNRYDIKRYDAASDIEKLVRDARELDCVFILLHGRYGEDGTVQGLLELLDIPYQGAGVLGSALAMDKHLSKVVYRHQGIPTPAWIHLDRDSRPNPDEIAKTIGLPFIVKPCNQGSSVGIEIIREKSKILQSISQAFTWDDEIILEQFIPGREITGGVIGLDELHALPIVEIIPDATRYDFFDYDAKYKPGATTEICPAKIPSEIFQQAQELALKAHKALKLSGYSRTDMIFNEAGKIYVIETNTIPGMTPTSLFPQAAAADGLDFSALLDRLIELALIRHKKSS